MNISTTNSMIKQLKILMVEDDVDVGNWLQKKVKSLEKVGVLHWSLSISEATQMLSQEIPDVIILDLSLPDGNGTEILRKVRNEKWPVKIIVFSINTGMRSVCRRLGADAFFDKGSESDELIEYLGNSKFDNS